jgi:hypothetical protein
VTLVSIGIKKRRLDSILRFVDALQTCTNCRLKNIKCVYECKTCEAGICTDQTCRQDVCGHNKTQGKIGMDCRSKQYPADAAWNHEYRACVNCQKTSQCCERDYVMAIVADGEWFKLLKMLQGRLPFAACFVDQPHMTRNYGNTPSQWLLRRNGNRFGLFLR